MTDSASRATRLQLRPMASIDEISPEDWNQFSGTGNPFLRHSFFAALEHSGCTTEKTGWEPAHIMVWLDTKLSGVIPAYRKFHSMGEYVFDWAWADAYQRYGLPYYPKLLMAVPFTPSMGARLLLHPDVRDKITAENLHQALENVATDLGCHSWHLLFPNPADQSLLQRPEQLQRLGCQFHWYNRAYHSFEDFLATLTSRKRKSIRRERRQVSEQGITFLHFTGTELPDHVLSAFYVFYQATYFKRGQRPYLNLEFFQALKAAQPEQMHVVMALHGDQMIAGALFLIGEDTLYGRYWGCLEEYNHLHFETCYYQGIELAIAKGLHCFDAGAQGEHKLVRGFEPVFTRSWHWLAHPGFHEAVANFCEEEAQAVEGYFNDSLEALPYRKEM